MKPIFGVFILLLCCTSGEAGRFILKNPQNLVQGKTLHTFQFANDTYVVAEVDDSKYSSFIEGEKPESLARESKIVSFETEPPGKPMQRAWHTDFLQYAALPKDANGKGVVVAVLDTGVDYNHYALKEQMWENTLECARMGNGLDNDGNGFINDCHGYDFTKKSGNSLDNKGHGTHCAGIIVANPDPESNARGIAPGARIMSVRVIGDDKFGFVSNAAAGIKYAVDNGARIISGSWRLYRSEEFPLPNDPNLELLRAAFQYADDRGVIFVTGAGNESGDLDSGLTIDPLYPASFTGLNHLVVVTASDQTSRLAFYANYGQALVTIAAPGDDIISTVPGGGWASKSGTSMATPLVAGLLARGLSEGQSPTFAVNRLKLTSDLSDYWRVLTNAGGIINPKRFHLGEPWLAWQ